MKKLILFALAVLVGTNAYAFGGGGSGRSSRRYEYGVNSFGIHHGGDKQVDIEFRECDSDTETLVGVECCLNDLIYTEKETQKCCNTPGYMVKNGACVLMEGTATLTQNDDNFVFTWKQPSIVSGHVVEQGAGSWILYYNASSRSSEVHDFSVDDNGHLQEKTWYPSSLDELEASPIKTNDITGWLKKLFGVKSALAQLVRAGLNTIEYQTISDADKCVMERGSWRLCACGGTLAKVGGQWTCSCPDGGSPSPGNYACCSADGYTYNTQTKAYDAIEAMYCGCPTGTKLVNQHFCCDSDGYAVWGKNNKEKSAQCAGIQEGCAADEIEVDESVGGCWKKCPAGSTFIEPFCCEGGWGAFYDVSTATWESYSVHPIQCFDAGCPGEGAMVRVDDGPTCCLNGKSYNPTTKAYDVVDANCPASSHCADGEVFVEPFCCRDGHGSAMLDGSLVSGNGILQCIMSESTDWNQDGNIFTFNYKVYYPEDLDNLMAGSWTVVYDAETNTFTVTDYYRASNGELKTVVWHPTSFEEIENTPVKQGEGHAFLNKLKELFGVKSAVASECVRPGTCGEDWSKYHNRISCWLAGGYWAWPGECISGCSPEFAWVGGSNYGGGVCCRNGYRQLGEVIEWVPYVCGCPDGGKPGKKSSFVCCKNGLSYHYFYRPTRQEVIEGGKYELIDIDNCGCPDDGEWKEDATGAEYCCKPGKWLSITGDSFEYKDATDPDTIKACGCPDNKTKYCTSANEDGNCEKYSCCAGTPTEKGTDGGQECCTGEEQPYCSVVNDDGTCGHYGCCAGTPTEKGTSGQQACCTGEEQPYCGLANDDGTCNWYSCCAGTPTEKGTSGQQECCNSSKVAEKDGIKTCCGKNEEPSGEQGSQICCENGKTNVNGACCENDKIIELNGVKQCGCPNGGTMSEYWDNDGKACYGFTSICCKDGKAWSEADQDYTDKLLGYLYCEGCPDGGLAYETYAIGGEAYTDCCKDKQMINLHFSKKDGKWCPDSYSYDGGIDPTDDFYRVCGCPDGKEAYTRSQDGRLDCCEEGKVKDGVCCEQLYEGNYEVCGCPTDDNGVTGTVAIDKSYGEEFKTCCGSNGLKWHYSNRYFAIDATTCKACPEGLEFKTGEQYDACCNDKGFEVYGHWPDYLEKYEGPVCCSYEYAGDGENRHCCDSSGKWTSEEGSGCCSDEGSEVHCECGCAAKGGTCVEKASAEHGWVCCDPNRTGYVLGSDDVDGACGCPDGYTASAVRGYEDICCSESEVGKAADGKNNFAACGCPADEAGQMSIEWKGDGVTGACCSNGWAYSEKTKKYDKINAVTCGCPSGSGSGLSDAGGSDKVCCVNGYGGVAWSSEKDREYEEDEYHCGCFYCFPGQHCPSGCESARVQGTLIGNSQKRDCCPWPMVVTIDGEIRGDCCVYDEKEKELKGRCDEYNPHRSEVCCLGASSQYHYRKGVCCDGMKDVETGNFNADCCDGTLVESVGDSSSLCCGSDGSETREDGSAGVTALCCAATNNNSAACCAALAEAGQLNDTESRYVTKEQWNTARAACCEKAYTDSEGYKRCCDDTKYSLNSPDYQTSCCDGTSSYTTWEDGIEVRKCCESVEDDEACCTAQAYQWITKDSGSKYCCYNGQDMGNGGNVTAICCMAMANNGPVESQCCTDDVLNDIVATTGEQIEWASKLHKQCCEQKGSTWGERQGTNGTESICCANGVENRVSWPLKCCGEGEHEETLTWNFYGTGTVCVADGEKAYPRRVCSGKDDKVCCKVTCKDDRHFGETSDGSIGGCCDDPNAFPIEYTDVDGKIQLGCCPLNKYPSPFRGVVDGTADFRCCAAGEHASPMNLNGKHGSWCCPSQTPYAKYYASSYYAADNPRFTSAIACCADDSQVADAHKDCCDSSDLVVEHRTDKLDWWQDKCCTSPSNCTNQSNKYYSFSRVALDGVCKCGCTSDSECNQNLASDEYREICQYDFTCKKPEIFTVKNVTFEVQDDFGGLASKEVLTQILDEADWSEATEGSHGARIVVATSMQDPTYQGRWLYGYHQGGEGLTIRVNAFNCVPKQTDAGRHFEAVVAVSHEGRHGVNELKKGGNVGRLGVVNAFDSYIDEIIAHKVGDKNLLKNYFKECYIGQTENSIGEFSQSDDCKSIYNQLGYVQSLATLENAVLGVDQMDDCDFERAWINSTGQGSAASYVTSQFIPTAESGITAYQNAYAVQRLAHRIMNVYRDSWIDGVEAAYKAYSDAKKKGLDICLSADEALGAANVLNAFKTAFEKQGINDYALPNEYVAACGNNDEHGCEDAEFSIGCMESGNCVTVAEFTDNWLNKSAKQVEYIIP